MESHSNHMKVSKDKCFVVVSHKFLTQPDDDLVLFLNNRKVSNVLHIKHSFSDAPDRKSRFTWYKNGIVYKRQETRDFKNFSEIIIYLKEGYYTCKWILLSRLKWDVYVGLDGLCTFFGIVIRSITKVKKTIYWAIDFVPEKRFKSPLKNKIYHVINTFGYKNANEMWDLSPRMAKARKIFLEIKESDYKRRIIVSYGVWTDRIRKYSYDDCEKDTIVFMGHLLEKQGAQLIIKALPELVKQNSKIRFKIIGGGQYKEALQKLARNLRVERHCDFLGKIEDHKAIEDEIAKSCIAVAPYIKKLDTWTFYADPGKIKTYLACGVPVLLTELPWNAKSIARSKSGLIITEDQKDIITKITFLMDQKVNEEFRQNALEYAERFNYNNIFKKLDI